MPRSSDGGDDVAAKRCSFCALNFPNSHEYSRCPSCEGTTSLIGNATPMTPAHARLVAARARFQRFYEAREDERERRGAPSPDELGGQEAAEILALEREVNQLPEPGDLPDETTGPEKAT